MLETLKQIDSDLFLTLNGLHSPFWDTIMYWISEKKTWIPLYAIILFFIIKKFRWKSIAIVVAVALVITLCDQISVKLFKDVFERFRPSHEPALAGLVHILDGQRGGKFGFVSSHAANTFGFAVFTLLLFKNRWFSLCIIFWAVVVSYSRIYLGLHYPGDILGGAMLGSLFGAFVFLIYKWMSSKIFK